MPQGRHFAACCKSVDADGLNGGTVGKPRTAAAAAAAAAVAVG